MMESTREDGDDDKGALANRIPRLQFKSTPNVINDQPEVIKEEGKSIFFEDERRRIDFILVYEGDDPKTELEKKRAQIREFFHHSLKALGLELEIDIQRSERHESIVFVKVHAPFKLLCRKAEKLKLKMPLRVKDPFAVVQDEYELATEGNNFSENQRPDDKRRAATAEKIRKRAMIIRNLQERPKRPPFPVYRHPKRVTAPFRQNKIDAFDIGMDRDDFFSPAERSCMVWEALQLAPNDPDDSRRRGIEPLLEMKIYESAFPLHDCDLSSAPLDIQTTHRLKQDRQVLYKTWANWMSIFKPQPIFLIRRYFGEKLAFYFSFLGFYTKMLIWPSIFSLCSFVYGFVYTGDDAIVNDVCDGTTEPGNWTACPICKPPHCEYDRLVDNCQETIWTYRMDNETTLVMCVLIVIWATVFLKAWKRKEAELAFDWDTYDLASKEATPSIRPDYEQRATEVRPNAVTGELERYVPRRMKLLRTTASTSVTILMLCAVVAALTCLVVARIALYEVFRNWGVRANVEMARWFVHGLIFIVVFVFDILYSWMAKKLTSLECPRTQDEWLSSFLWKVFVFELLNDFVPLIYAAWIKGNMVDTPVDLTWNSELCEPSGCLGEVTELVAVLLLARMAVGNLYEIGWPALKRFSSRICGRKRVGVKEPRWQSDYKLEEAELDGVSAEYMEMMVQFAFVTLFAPALPMAPFVCLLNNVLEIRVDAINFVVSCRRPLPVRAPGIEIWNDFLSIISKMAIVCNAAIISFTSDIIPRLYFKYGILANPETASKYVGFHTFVLSKIPTTNMSTEAVLEDVSATTEADPNGHDESGHSSSHEHHPDLCYYRGFRSPEYPYEVRGDWWQVACVRLAAFCLFVLLGFSFQFLYSFIVPDVPKTVQLQIQRRRYIISKILEKDTIASVAAVEQQAAAMAALGRDVRSAREEADTLLRAPIRRAGDTGSPGVGTRGRTASASLFKDAPETRRFETESEGDGGMRVETVSETGSASMGRRIKL